jgi:hypothetical protein
VTAYEFAKGDAWARRKQDLCWEILAVALPVMAYVVVAIFQGLAGKNPADWREVLAKPEGFFGASILFFFAAIQGLRARQFGDAANTVVRNSPRVYQVAGGVAGCLCIIAGALCIVFHPEWGFVTGCFLILVSIRMFWRASFLRLYLDSTSAIATMPHRTINLLRDRVD